MHRIDPDHERVRQLTPLHGEHERLPQFCSLRVHHCLQDRLHELFRLCIGELLCLRDLQTEAGGRRFLRCRQRMSEWTLYFRDLLCHHLRRLQFVLDRRVQAGR